MRGRCCVGTPVYGPVSGRIGAVGPPCIGLSARRWTTIAMCWPAVFAWWTDDDAMVHSLLVVIQIRSDDWGWVQTTLK